MESRDNCTNNCGFISIMNGKCKCFPDAEYVKITHQKQNEIFLPVGKKWLENYVKAILDNYKNNK